MIGSQRYTKAAQTYLRQKLAQVADLDMQSFDLLLHIFLAAVFSIKHPKGLIVLHVDLSINDHITTIFVPITIKKMI